MDELIRCRDCRFFCWDYWARVNDIPLIVAHDMCMKWGGGYRPKADTPHAARAIGFQPIRRAGRSLSAFGRYARVFYIYFMQIGILPSKT